MAWYAILESRMQNERRGLQLLSDSEVFTIHKKGGEGPDFLRFVNLLDGVGKMIFGGWLELIEDLYRHWQFAVEGLQIAWPFVGPPGSVLQRQVGAKANSSGTLLRPSTRWTESSIWSM